ncbi:hypothetical protein KI387_010587, partial [Taxus chinensis]
EDNNDSSSNRVSASAAGVAIKPSEDAVCVNPTNVRPERIYVTNVNPLEVERIQEERCTDFGLEGTSPSSTAVKEVDQSPFEKEAWKLLRDAVVSYCGSPVGTVAANDPSGGTNLLNYDQVFIRDFVPSALAFMLRGETEIVRNFLLHTLQLQSWEKTVDCYSPGQGLMPASFKVRTVPLDGNNEAVEEVLDPDFGESAIGRVAPVDSGLWWIILLRAYGRITGDFALQERVDVQTGIKLILKLCLADGFDMFPTLLVTDGSCMIDRRMGIHGHPLEIQALFYSALRCAREVLIVDDGSLNLMRAVNSRLSALAFHIREYYWLDMRKLNEIYRYKTEEYSHDAVNKFNIYPDQIPSWLVDWMPDQGGFLIGNLQPAHMDFRFFSLGNLWAITTSLTTPEQAESILNLIQSKWDDLVGKMPMKICFPALEYEEWRIITGSDPKNTPWSYHNGGSWPTLLWQLTVACIKMGRPDLAARAVDTAEKRLSKDRWPEYYDTKTARFIGKQARLYQTWSIAGYLVSKSLLANPKLAAILTCEEDLALMEGCSYAHVNPIYDEATTTELRALYSNSIPTPDHIQQLLEGQKYVPTNFFDSPIGISIVDDPITFTHCTPCHPITCDPHSDLSLETLDGSIIDYLLDIDNHSQVHIDSSTPTTDMVPSHNSTASDISSPTTYSDSLHYVDDPIDHLFRNDITSEALSDISEAVDTNDSPNFHTAECKSPSPPLSSPEIVSSIMHGSPPSLTSPSHTASYPLITSSTPIISSSPTDASPTIISPIRDIVDVSPTIVIDASHTIASSTPTSSVHVASKYFFSPLDIPMITHNEKLQPLNTSLSSSTIPSHDIISLMHAVGQLQS